MRMTDAIGWGAATGRGVVGASGIAREAVRAEGITHRGRAYRPGSRAARPRGPRARGRAGRSVHDDRLTTPKGRVAYPPPQCLHFIDQIALPFLTSLYGAVGYLGVLVAMAIESAMIPLPSELILPLGGFQVSDAAAIEPLTRGPWNFWIVVVVATIGNTVGSLIAYTIGAYGGRPFLERYGKYLFIRQHEIEIADRFFAKYGPHTAFFSRLLPIVRTFISFPAGVARMPIVPFVVYSTAGAFIWSTILVWAGVQLGANWTNIRKMLEPFDLAIAVLLVVGFLVVVWLRFGRPIPGRPRKPDAGAE